MSYAIQSTIILMILGSIGYALAFRAYGRMHPFFKLALFLVSFGIMVMWLFYHFTVFHILDMEKLIRFLSVFKFEYTSFFVGIFSALSQQWINKRYKFKGIFTRHNGFVLTLFLMVPVYIYPIIYPVDIQFLDRWENEVCLQSTPESCAPACIATMLNFYGIKKTEEEIASRVYLSKMGTDVWHISRYIKSHGLNAKIISIPEKPENPPVPCIATVSQDNEHGFYHCIVILAKTENGFTIADPQYGLIRTSKKQVFQNYKFLGYLIHVTSKK